MVYVVAFIAWLQATWKLIKENLFGTHFKWQSMFRIKIDGIVIVKYNPDLSLIHWLEMSRHLSGKYGTDPQVTHATVEAILLDGFQFLLARFTDLIREETSLRFYQYIFWLHEESIKLYRKTLDPRYTLRGISADELAGYRRTLKLVAEQGCDVDFVRGPMIDADEMHRIDEKLQHLLYLSTWLYSLADEVAIMKMIPNSKEIDFDQNGMMGIGWQSHYGYAYDALISTIRTSYAAAIYDEQGIQNLTDAIEAAFGVKYDFAGGVIFDIKRHHAPEAPDLQDIQASVLSENLVRAFAIDRGLAEAFYAGLSISRANKLTIEETILKPHSLRRYMFRPILIYNINGEDRALVGIGKYLETMFVLATNAIHWNQMPDEWNSVKDMREFGHKTSREHDRILEDNIERIFRDTSLPFARNIKSFKQLTGTNIRIDNTLVGEIDFIVVNETLRRVFVCDTKYNRARYEMIGFRIDNSNFISHHEPQLERKRLWVEGNLNVVQQHLNIVWGLTLNLAGYTVEGAFLINTPTFYMFNGSYRAVTIDQVTDYFTTLWQFPVVEIYEPDGTIRQRISHPFFR